MFFLETQLLNGGLLVRTGFTTPVSANRGASGIDGVLSSAAGYAEGLGRGVTLAVGDVSFLHDVNGLNLLRTSGARPPLTVRHVCASCISLTPATFAPP